MSHHENQELSPLAKPPITREQLKHYALTSGDVNPIHLDEQFAKDAGFPSVIAHGMLSMAFLGDYINQQFPTASYRLVRFKARFKKITFPGDTITCLGKLRSMTGNEITIALTTRNQRNEETTSGEAVVRRVVPAA